MIKFVYTPDENAFNDSNMQVEMTFPDDVTLSGLFNNFIELTRIIGYQSKSWDNIIRDIEKADIVADEYTLFDYALDHLF